MGRYFIFDPVTQREGGAAFAPNSRMKPNAFLDGLSNTIALSEVKAFNPRFHDSVLPTTEPATADAVAGTISADHGPNPAAIPSGFVDERSMWASRPRSRQTPVSPIYREPNV